MNAFQEKLYEHHSQVFTMDADLYRARTKFQDVLIFENRLFGRVMVLDGVVQLTERDNYIYHEMIAHVPLMAHGAAKRVLIIGGGDGGTLKEVLKHPVERSRACSRLTTMSSNSRNGSFRRCRTAPSRIDVLLSSSETASST